ncbi:hypothetical protein [Psychrobacter celer]|uniref:hypothetical protein n=1 Tax=Psychrobacter celer TaxID=306572 RepID=UPI003FD557E9
MDHFFNKYNSFDDSFKCTASKLLSSMLIDSKKSDPLDPEIHYYEEGNNEQDEFMQAMFYCFKLLNEYKGRRVDLIKSIHTNLNRSEGYWFPIAVISEPLGNYSNEPPEVILYRGCCIDEYNSKDYKQPWTSDLDTAKRFAFIYGDSDKNNRVVVKAKVKNTDIAWIVEITTEHEVVLLPEFSPIEDAIKLNYTQYCECKNQ